MNILEDILVLDLTDEKGAYGSRLLADLGADVIKVESPCGDPSRHLGPFLSPDPDGASFSLSFIYNNSNKRSIALDLRTGDGIRAFEMLVKKADVLMGTFSPGHPEKPDLDYAELSRMNPGLIYLSISAFGRSGPKRAYKSSDTVASASGGRMLACRDDCGRPVKLYGMQSCYAASLYGAVAVLLNLRKRKRTGAGSYIDLSIQESVASTLDRVMVDYFDSGRIAGLQDSYRSGTDFTALPCRDGYILIAILQNWETLLEIMASENRAEDLPDKEWQDRTYRENHFDHIVEAVKGWTGSHTRQELFELGQAMRFPWAPVATSGEVPESSQLKSRRFFINCALSAEGPQITMPGSPYIFSSFSRPPAKSAPLPGEHTIQILNELASKKDSRDLPHPNAQDCSPNDKALNGIRVLDLTRMLSGPYCTRILADSGAEVIKVQTGKTARGAERNDTAYFSAWNRNKRSISLNLDTSEARECFLKLAAISGIVVENYAPRVMANWGLTYDRLREVNPSLIMLSLSAMGQTGPWKEYVGFGPTFHALSGLIAASSEKSAPPITIGHAYGDTIIGLYGALAILAALEFRDKTGEGLYIDLSGYEALCTLLGPALMQNASPGDSVLSNSRRENEAGAFPDRCYPCLGVDRWCAITVSADDQWHVFCNILDNPDLKSERFSTAAGRIENQAELDKLIECWTTGHSAESVEAVLQKAGIAASVALNAEDLAKDPQLAARNFFVTLEHPALGTAIADRSALLPPDIKHEGWLAGRSLGEGWRPSPSLGEANYDIFVKLLGMPDETFRSFIKRSIIG